MKNILNELIEAIGYNHTLYSKIKKNEQLHKWIIDKTKEFNKYLDVSLPERVFCLINDISDRPLCKKCLVNHTVLVPVVGGSKKYRDYCSVKCAITSCEIQEKIKKTNMKNFGVPRASMNPKCVEKARKTSLEKYGTEYYMRTNEYKNKVKKTNLEKYGTEWNVSSKNNKKKREETMVERFGVDNYFKRSDLVKTKMLEKYGQDNPSKIEEFQDKKRKTWLEKYGVENPALCPDIIEKIKIARANSEHTACFFSKISQELFWELDKYVESCYFAEKNKEIATYDKSCKRAYYLDFAIIDYDKKVAIEFNGDFWHMNPDIFSESQINPVSKLSASEIWKYNDQKISFFTNIGWKILIIWENEYIDDKEKTISKCVEFLKMTLGEDSVWKK